MSDPFLIDLDEQRAARAEEARVAPVIRLGGEEFTLPVEMPYEFAELLSLGDISGAVRALLAADSDRFFNQQPSVTDITSLAEGLNTAYGLESGKSNGSAGSSKTGGGSSKPTSKGSTGSSSRSKSKTADAAV